jgi:hypothetical protein
MKIKKILLSAILLLFCLPYLQSELQFAKEKPLSGYFSQLAEPSLDSLSLASWKKGSFQDEIANRVNNHLGFRPSLLRINNQVDYSLFGLTHADGFVKGVGRNFFQDDYISEFDGRFFIGRGVLLKKLWKLKNVQDSLEAHGIHMLLVIEPCKVSYFTESVPPHLMKQPLRESNYHFISSRLDSYGIHNLDLNSWFRLIKDTSRYPLFPPYGMHWSVYGEHLSLDTIMRSLERTSGLTMPRIRITGIRLSDSLYQTDNDIGQLLNLVWDLRKVRLPYPEISIDRKGVDTSLKTLVIADSYYETILRDVRWPLFPGSEFWYYNSMLYPYIYDNTNTRMVDKSEILNKYNKFKVILLMTSGINFHSFLWNFMDEAYVAFHPGYKEPPVYEWENAIRNLRTWFEKVVVKAEKRGRPLELQLHDEAEWMLKQNAARAN